MLIVQTKKKPSRYYGIGPRTLKTALAAFICIVGARLIRYEYMPTYACVTTCIAMQDTSKHSIELGKNRLIATGLAGSLSLLSIWFLGIMGKSNLAPYFAPLIMIVGFAICNITGKKDLCGLTGVVILAIMLGDASVTPIPQAIRRLSETGAGVIIAVLVNKYIMPMDKSEKKEDEQPDTILSDEDSADDIPEDEYIIDTDNTVVDEDMDEIYQPISDEDPENKQNNK